MNQCLTFALILAGIISLIACNHSKTVSSSDPDIESETVRTTDDNHVDTQESEEESASGSIVDATDDSADTDVTQFDSDSGARDIAYFDTDPSGNCVHPVVVENCSDGWCEIPPGCYINGSPQEQPCRGANTETQVQVTLTRAFLIQQYEVTQREWEAAGFNNPMTTGPFPDLVAANKPITYVNWYEAMAYANYLSKKEGLDECYDLSRCTGDIGTGCKDNREFCFINLWHEIFDCPYDPHVFDDWYSCNGYRLPTAAEWEYAARAGTQNATYNGDFENSLIFNECEEEPSLEPIAWYRFEVEPGDLHPGGMKLPNKWGLFDMLGNAGEWVDYIFTGWSLGQNEDITDGLVDPVGPLEEADFRRSCRGGSYIDTGCILAASYQQEFFASDRSYTNGFRLVRTLFSDGN